MKSSKTHAYRGITIFAVSCADRAAAGYRWYVQTIHSPTGLPYDSQHCQHYRTLADAREAIDEKEQQQAALEGSEALG